MNAEEENREFRGQLRQAWFESSLERDRSILMLSSGAIGILFVIVDKYPIHSALVLVLFLGALLAFIISVVAAVWIFKENCSIVSSQIKGKNSTSKLAGALDMLLVGGFSLGLVLSSTLTVLYAVDIYSNNKPRVNKDMNDEQTDNSGKPKKAVNESYEGVSEIRPGGKDTLKASFQDVKDIAPAPPPKDPPVKKD